jgi:CBS domain containing-hemolysin-like protein
MIPRSQVVALDGGRTLREVLPEVRRRPHSFYPVYEGVIDQPLGVVRILDLSEPESADRPLRERVHPVAILPETVRGLRLLRDLARAPIPAALVVDEFGSMAGLVTIEDLMEVVIGDLEGEHEIVRARILSEGDGAWRIEGTCTVEEFCRRFGPLIPEGEYETVAGFFLDRRGEIPEAGAELALPGLRLEVVQASERRIVWLRAEVPGAAGARG